LREYYKQIKYPVSLRQVQKKVSGVRGREAPTGESIFKSWREFETEASYIWRNAWEFNEDGSEIYVMATQLGVSSSIIAIFFLPMLIVPVEIFRDGGQGSSTSSSCSAYWRPA
jgi:Bromodomain